MRLLEIRPNLPYSKSQLVLIIGLGLIGNSVFKILNNYVNCVIGNYNFSWLNPLMQDIELKNMAINFNSILGNKSPFNQYSQLDILWCAGKCGFNASEQQTHAELETFRKISLFTSTLSANHPHKTIRFHLISSAGGLFEGQKEVNFSNPPVPYRPYGILKLCQENIVLSMPNAIQKIIYRPSSVYGPIQKLGRLGLIPALILNGLSKKVTYISGNLTTLRDYIFVSDVGRFIVSKVLFSDKLENLSIFFIVSGKPTSILEIKKHIEKKLNRKIYLNFNYTATNDRNITFHQNVLPYKGGIVDLATGINIVYHTWKSYGDYSIAYEI